MSLVNKKVTHAVFGQGCIKAMENGRITVAFSEKTGEKIFQYPGAFEQYLKICDASVQGTVEQDLKELLEGRAASDAEIEETLQEQARVFAESRAAARKIARRKAASKTAERARNDQAKLDEEQEQEEQEEQEQEE